MMSSVFIWNSRLGNEFSLPPQLFVYSSLTSLIFIFMRKFPEMNQMRADEKNRRSLVRLFSWKLRIGQQLLRRVTQQIWSKQHFMKLGSGYTLERTAITYQMIIPKRQKQLNQIYLWKIARKRGNSMRQTRKMKMVIASLQTLFFISLARVSSWGKKCSSLRCTTEYMQPVQMSQMSIPVPNTLQAAILPKKCSKWSMQLVIRSNWYTMTKVPSCPYRITSIKLLRSYTESTYFLRAVFSRLTKKMVRAVWRAESPSRRQRFRVSECLMQRPISKMAIQLEQWQPSTGLKRYLYESWAFETSRDLSNNTILGSAFKGTLQVQTFSGAPQLYTLINTLSEYIWIMYWQGLHGPSGAC